MFQFSLKISLSIQSFAIFSNFIIIAIVIVSLIHFSNPIIELFIKVHFQYPCTFYLIHLSYLIALTVE